MPQSEGCVVKGLSRTRGGSWFALVSRFFLALFCVSVGVKHSNLYVAISLALYEPFNLYKGNDGQLV